MDYARRNAEGLQISSLIHQGERDLRFSLDYLSGSECESAYSRGIAQALRLSIKDKPSPLPAWAYLGYYRIGRLLLNEKPENLPFARQLIHDICISIDCFSANQELVAFGDPSIASKYVWAAVIDLFQEGGDFVQDLESPDPENLEHWRQTVIKAKRWIENTDPELHVLMNQLQSLIIAAKPGPQSRVRHESFGGATCFFFRGGTLLNASNRISTAEMVEQLVHEYAHAELFVLGQDEPLCLNHDDERHKVLIRSDPRPMNGIIHSLYVVSRVAELLGHIIDKATAIDQEEFPDTNELTSILRRQFKLGESSLGTIRRHARLTQTGNDVVDAATHRLLVASNAV